MATKTAPITVEEIRAELCRQDFAEYCRFVHGRPLYRHQVEWIKELQKPKSRVLIVAPPESFKSSTMRMRVEWEIGNKPDLRVLLVMNTAQQAQRQVQSVGETLTSNARYRQVFPWVEANPKRGWSHEVLFVRRTNESLPDPTLYGTGIDGPYQGSHVDRIFCDDPTDQQDVHSAATMEQQRARLHGVLLDRLEENGSFIGILTRWGEADLVRDFREMGFAVLENPIEGRYPWGRLLCPEVFGDDRLAAIKVAKGMNGQLYQLTYMCNPAAAEGTLLKREWWRMYSALPEMERVIHSWDLSTGRSELGDYSAYQSWGVSEEGFYLIDAGRWRLAGDALEQKMKLLYEQSKPRAQYILVEDAGNAIPVIQSLQAHTRLPIMPIKPGRRDKVARLQGVQGLIEGGRVWLPAKAQWLEDFLDEMSVFPGGRFDDQVDALSQSLEYLDRQGPTSGTFIMRRHPIARTIRQ